MKILLYYKKGTFSRFESTKTFHSYLDGQEILLRTNNTAVNYLRNLKKPTGQVARWLQELDTYNFKVVHRAGRQHSNADALSRRPCRVCQKQEQSNLECNNDEDCEAPQLAEQIIHADLASVLTRSQGAIQGDDLAQSHAVLEVWTPDNISSLQLEDQDIYVFLIAIE